MVPAGFIFPPISQCWILYFVGDTFHTSSSIDDQKKGSHECEDKDRACEDGASSPFLDQGCNQDSTDTLSGLVNTLRSTHCR